VSAVTNPLPLRPTPLEAPSSPPRPGSATGAEAVLAAVSGGRTADPDHLADRVKRARDGEVGAFEDLYRACVGRIYATCLRLHGGRREDAEDSVQEAFVRAWRRLPSFRGEAGFPTWLHRIAVNASLDRLRTAKAREPLGMLPDDPALLERAAGRPGSPEAGIDLERAIAGLPEGARVTFLLHDVEGFRHGEIAAMTGTAEGTSKSQLHRARRLLREALER
jgi:RNA polymerase sigma-70 factor (ECF subfamily)